MSRFSSLCVFFLLIFSKTSTSIFCFVSPQLERQRAEKSRISAKLDEAEGNRSIYEAHCQKANPTGCHIALLLQLFPLQPRMDSVAIDSVPPWAASPA